MKCFKNSLASSNAGEPFCPSLGHSILSLDPGPNRQNLKYRINAGITYQIYTTFFCVKPLLTSSSVVSSASSLHCGERSSQAIHIEVGKYCVNLEQKNKTERLEKGMGHKAQTFLNKKTCHSAKRIKREQI